MFKGNQLLVLFILISGCGIHTERDGTNRSHLTRTSLIPHPEEQNSKDLYIKNEFTQNQEFHFRDPETGVFYVILGRTKSPLLASTVKKGRSRLIGKITLKYHHIRYESRYEHQVKPSIFYTTQKYPLAATLIHDESTSEIWIGIPEIHESLLTTTSSSIRVDSIPTEYCSKAKLEIKLLGNILKNEFDCTPQKRCFTENGNGMLSKILEAGGSCIQHNFAYEKTEIRNNVRKPIEIILEVEKEDPSNLETIRIDLS
jgi:hypothetical protein